MMTGMKSYKIKDEVFILAQKSNTWAGIMLPMLNHCGKTIKGEVEYDRGRPFVVGFNWLWEINWLTVVEDEVDT